MMDEDIDSWSPRTLSARFLPKRAKPVNLATVRRAAARTIAQAAPMKPTPSGETGELDDDEEDDDEAAAVLALPRVWVEVVTLAQVYSSIGVKSLSATRVTSAHW